MVDSAASGLQAFGNGTLGEAPLGTAPPSSPPGEQAAYQNLIDGLNHADLSADGLSAADLSDADADADADETEPGVEDPGWAASLRRIGRAGAWALPLGAFGLVVTALWSWPQPGLASNRPGTWLVITIASFAFGLIGVVSITALLAPTPGRGWAVAGATATALGTALLAPVLGVVALARPAVTNAAESLGGSSDALQASLVDGTVARWLLVGGLALLAVGICLLGIAVLASALLARFDGYLLLGAIGLAVFAAWASWQFLLVIAAIALLAAGLGLAWTASRVTPDGRGPDIYPD